MKVPKLKSELLTLRPLEPEDLQLLYDLENDSTLWDSSNTTAPYSKFTLKNYIQSTQGDIFADKEVRLIIERNTDGLAVGMIDLYNFSPLHHRVEVGVVVFKGYRQKGYALEAIRLLKRYAFTFLMLHQMYAFIKSENKISTTLFEKAGFSHIATLPEWFYSLSGYSSVNIYQLTNKYK